MANEFFTLLTASGKAKLAAAQANGAPLQISQMAVGDGDNGGDYTPSESQTALKHETWRGALNHLAVDPNNPNWVVAEAVLPDTVGGFYIREVGLFDSRGDLIAIGKFPESYKPLLAAGANKQLYVRMILEVSNTAAVTLLVDPSVVLATRSAVEQRIAEELAKRDAKPRDFHPLQGFPTQAYRRNVLINGGFDVWQRGASQTVGGYGSVDRWFLDLGGGPLGGATLSRMAASIAETETLGATTSFMRLTLSKPPASKVNEYCQVCQPVENLRRFTGKRMTLSFWAKADQPRKMVAYVEQWLKRPPAASDKIRALEAVPVELTSRWQRFVFSFSSPSLQGREPGNEASLAVFLGVSYSDAYPALNAITGAQTGTFDIAQVQLEESPVATPFEYRSFGEELTLCQRYFEKSYPLNDFPAKNYGADSAFAPAIFSKMFHLNVGTSGDKQINMTIPFMVEKRIEPAIVIYDGLGAVDRMATSNGNGVIPAAKSSSTKFVNMIPPTGSSITWVACHWVADAEI